MKFLTAIGIIICLGACTEEFYPDTTNYENLLVVDGLVTDRPGPYFVSLHMSMKLNEHNSVPVQKAKVIIKSSLREQFDLYEVSPGLYSTDSATCVGRQGVAYYLSIETSDGKSYESTPETIGQPIEIDNLSWDFVEDNANGTGVAIYATSRQSDSTQYLRWEFDEYWEIVPSVMLDTLPQNSFSPWPQKDHLPDICYLEARSSGITIATSENNTENRIVNHELTKIYADNSRLNRRYGIKVVQHTLSARQYAFWKQLAYYDSQDGSLYDSYPSPVKGNVKCLSSPDEPVLGGFFASATTTKNFFITNKDIRSKMPYINDGYNCEVTQIGVDTLIKVYSPDSLERLPFYINALFEQLNNGTFPPEERPEKWIEYNQLKSVYRRFCAIRDYFYDWQFNKGLVFIGTICWPENDKTVCKTLWVPQTYCFDCRRIGTDTIPPIWDAFEE